jgi:Flp pilus assembly protein CpaB
LILTIRKENGEFESQTIMRRMPIVAVDADIVKRERESKLAFCVTLAAFPEQAEQLKFEMSRGELRLILSVWNERREAGIGTPTTLVDLVSEN